LIYHIAYAEDWASALRDGAYTVSTRGLSLAEQGFIHASTAGQVAGVANAFYAGESGLVLLMIEEDKLTPPLRYEPAPGGDELFPHLYGPLNPDAVVDTVPFTSGADGRFEFPAAG
jgi:glutathione S-transferase